MDAVVRDAMLELQVIHTSLIEGILHEMHLYLSKAGSIFSVPSVVSKACLEARNRFELCRGLYQKLAELIPTGQYYRYNDHWSFLTQKLVFLIALTVFIEAGFLVERDTVAEILGRELILRLLHVFLHNHVAHRE